MTTVAWDGRTLAADKQSTYMIPVTTSKIESVKWKGKPAYAAGSGPIRDFMPFIEALKEGKKLPDVDQDDPSFDVLVVTHDGNLILFNGSSFPHEMGITKYAIGSGAGFALGAMYAGATSAEAVMIASKLDTGTGLGVDTVSFAAPKTTAKRPSKKVAK